MNDELLAPMSILIVEDHDDSAQSCAELLNLHGHDVRVASCSSEALQEAGSNPPDVILLDIGLPGMNGWDLAGQLKALAKPPVIIAITGYGRQEDLHRSEEAGIHLHLVKPVNPGTLIGLLKYVSKAILPPGQGNCSK